jgi:hypothetical protein
MVDVTACDHHAVPEIWMRIRFCRRKVKRNCVRVVPQKPAR